MYKGIYADLSKIVMTAINVCILEKELSGDICSSNCASNSDNCTYFNKKQVIESNLTLLGIESPGNLAHTCFTNVKKDTNLLLLFLY